MWAYKESSNAVRAEVIVQPLAVSAAMTSVIDVNIKSYMDRPILTVVCHRLAQIFRQTSGELIAYFSTKPCLVTISRRFSRPPM